MKLQDYIDYINNNKLLVIVEGKNDEKSLKALGIKRIFPINSKPLYKVVDEINEKEVVILTDLDPKGRQIYHKLKTQLTNKGIKIYEKFRLFLFENKISTIEGIAHYFNKNGNKQRNKNN